MLSHLTTTLINVFLESKRNEVEQKLDTNKKPINDEELEKLLSIALSEKQINLPASAGDLLKYIEKVFENKIWWKDILLGIVESHTGLNFA